MGPAEPWLDPVIIEANPVVGTLPMAPKGDINGRYCSLHPGGPAQMAIRTPAGPPLQPHSDVGRAIGRVVAGPGREVVLAYHGMYLASIVLRLLRLKSLHMDANYAGQAANQG